MVIEDQATLDGLYKGYGDIPPFGNGPDQQLLQTLGNKYIRDNFPNTDFIFYCNIASSGASAEDDGVAEQTGGTTGTTELHGYASSGDVENASLLLDEDRDFFLNARDANGWQPIHEAVRSGHIDMVRFLVEEGADYTSKTVRGGTALWWGKQILGEHHEVVQYLSSIGAPDEADFN